MGDGQYIFQSPGIEQNGRRASGRCAGGRYFNSSFQNHVWCQTDRIGSYSEIEPYFPVWRNLQVKEGVLAVIEIEHDALSEGVPVIPKGTDGRSLR